MHNEHLKNITKTDKCKNWKQNTKQNATTLWWAEQ